MDAVDSIQSTDDRKNRIVRPRFLVRTEAPEGQGILGGLEIFMLDDRRGDLAATKALGRLSPQRQIDRSNQDGAVCAGHWLATRLRRAPPSSANPVDDVVEHR